MAERQRRSVPLLQHLSLLKCKSLHFYETPHGDVRYNGRQGKEEVGINEGNDRIAMLIGAVPAT